MARRVATPSQLYRLNKAGALLLNPYVVTECGEQGEIEFPLASSAIAELAGNDGSGWLKEILDVRSSVSGGTTQAQEQ